MQNELAKCLMEMIGSTVHLVFSKLNLAREYVDIIISDILIYILEYTYPYSIKSTKGRKDKYGYFTSSILNAANKIFRQRYGQHAIHDEFGYLNVDDINKRKVDRKRIRFIELKDYKNYD
jgi:hypothetical protein